MKKAEKDAFIGFYDNGTYRVGCNGTTVYVFNSDSSERGQFRDFPYAYYAAFMPGRNIIAVKSTANRLAFYDLDTMTLLAKHRLAYNGCQDDGFTFSADGTRFYNIERVKTSLRTQLTVFETGGFTKVCSLFGDEPDMVLNDIEVDREAGVCYVLGFMQNPESGLFHHGFVAVFDESERAIVQHRVISKQDYRSLQAFKSWERAGFTEKANRFNLPLKDLTPVLSLLEQHKLTSESLGALLPLKNRDQIRPVSIREMFARYE